MQIFHVSSFFVIFKNTHLILCLCFSPRFSRQQLDSWCNIRKEVAPSAALSGPLFLPQPPQKQVPMRFWCHYRLDSLAEGLVVGLRTVSLWANRLCHILYTTTVHTHHLNLSLTSSAIIVFYWFRKCFMRFGK